MGQLFFAVLPTLLLLIPFVCAVYFVRWLMRRFNAL